MFYSTSTKTYISEGTAFEINGVQYPQNWLNLSTPEEKAELGLVEVVATNQPANQIYYWVSEELNGAELTYVNTPKDLDSVKETALSQVNSTAYSILFPTDWMVVKAFETGTRIATDWNTWRASIRATANTTRTAITEATTVDAVEAIMSNIEWAKDPNQPVIEPIVESIVETTKDL